MRFRGWSVAGGRADAPIVVRCAANEPRRRSLTVAITAVVAVLLDGGRCTFPLPGRASARDAMRFTLVQPDIRSSSRTLDDPTQSTKTNFAKTGEPHRTAARRGCGGWCCGPNRACPTTSGTVIRSAYYDQLDYADGNPGNTRAGASGG